MNVANVCMIYCVASRGVVSSRTSATPTPSDCWSATGTARPASTTTSRARPPWCWPGSSPPCPSLAKLMFACRHTHTYIYTHTH